MTNGDMDVDWDFLTPEFIEMKSRFNDELRRPLPNDTNVNVGIFTTSYARAHLYEGLSKLGRRVVYHDTDSILFTYRLTDKPISPLPLGDFLGQWTDELDGAHICEFFSAGPKNYAFKDSKGKEIIKCKGFNLNKSNVKSKFSLALFKKAVDAKSSGKDDIVQTVQFKLDQGGILVRDVVGKIQSQESEKDWRCVYTKRNIVFSETSDSDKFIDTLPFGYINN
jgi:hypothetical protein